MSRGLEAGAALGAAGLFFSSVSLLSSHAPKLPAVADAGPGSGTADDLRAAEVTTALLVAGAGAVAGIAARQWWPFLLAVGSVGGAILVYEATLAYKARGVK